MRTAVQLRAKASQSMDFGVTDKFEQGDEVIKMESMNRAERLHQAFKDGHTKVSRPQSRMILCNTGTCTTEVIVTVQPMS